MSSPKKELQLWFKLARGDFNMAHILFENGNSESWRGVTYHCQQAAEKSIKGFLVYKKINFSRKHDIGSLTPYVVDDYPELDPLMDRASNLTKYALYNRYPDAMMGEITLEQVQEAMDCAKTTISEVSARIPFESQWDL